MERRKTAVRPGSRSEVTRSNTFLPSAERSIAFDPSSQERSRSEGLPSRGRPRGSASSRARRVPLNRPRRHEARASPERRAASAAVRRGRRHTGSTRRRHVLLQTRPRGHQATRSGPTNRPSLSTAPAVDRNGRHGRPTRGPTRPARKTPPRRRPARRGSKRPGRSIRRAVFRGGIPPAACFRRS